MVEVSMRVVLSRAARREHDDAGDWYESKQAGLGVRFSDAVQGVLDRIAQAPESYAESPDVAGVREAPLSGWPHCVYHRVESDRVLVLAVFHTSRDPSEWQKRG